MKALFLSSALLLPIPSSHAAGVGIGFSESAFFWGGGVGASFGDVDTLTVSPHVGMNITPKWSVGLGLDYTRRTDDRYSPRRTYNDTGLTLFTRYSIIPGFFVEADVESLNYEYYTNATSKQSADFTSFLAGGGIRSSLGGNTSTYVSALYNFSYDDADSPYDDPWTIRAGIGFGF